MLPSLNISPWKEELLSVLAQEILSISPKPLISIDGKGGSGKTSFAVKLADALNANIVSTDDACWYADPIHWDDEILNGIIQPWLNGKSVAYTPSGWIKQNRDGCIEVDSSRALVFEGSGACRKTLRKVVTYSIWIDTDPNIARERVIQRDFANGVNGGTIESVTEFTDWWDSVVDPFLIEEASWNYVDVIVSGTQSDFSSNTLMVHYPSKPILAEGVRHEKKQLQNN